MNKLDTVTNSFTFCYNPNISTYDNDCDSIFDDYDKIICIDSIQTINTTKNNKLCQWDNLEPYSNTFKEKQICWFPVYIQISNITKDSVDYLVLKDISNDHHRATYYKISGEYNIVIYYDGYSYKKQSFINFEYIPCHILPCDAKDILIHNSSCKLEETALLLKEIWEDLRKNDASAINQNIWFEHEFYYHTEYYMKNKFIHFDF